MSLPPLCGHEMVWQRLRETIARKRLPHALLFTGPPGVGKSLAARLLTLEIACGAPGGDSTGDCGRRVAAGTHPDLFLLRVPQGKKEIGVDLARRLKRFVQMHPVSAQRKMAIIDEADRLSVAAQNALLKTLEEPPGHALVVLVAASAGALLPTVRSRCQRILFQPLTEAQVSAVLQDHGLDATEAGTLARHAEGSPGRALELREIWRGHEHGDLVQMVADLDPTRYVSVVAMSKGLGRTEHDMAVSLAILLAWFRDAAVQAAVGARGDTDAAGPARDPESVRRAADAVADALRTLWRYNPNRPLLAEALALRLARS